MDERPASPEERLLPEALRRLNAIGAAINRLGASDPVGADATLRLIVESAANLVPGASAVIYTYNPQTPAFDSVSRVAAGPDAAALAGDEPRPDGLGARAIHRRRTTLSYEESDLAIHPAKAASGAVVAACFPLVIAEQPLGVLYVYLADERRFTPIEMLLLNSLVNQAALALFHIGQARDVRRDLTRKEDELALLRRAGLLISSRSRLDDTLEAILQMALEVTGARYGIFRLVDASGQHLVMRAIAGDRLGRPAVEALPLNTTSIMGWVAKTRQPLNVADVRRPPWDRIYYPLDHSLQMRSDLAVPLVGAGGRLEGVLNLESPLVAAFSEADSHLLQALAVQAVIAIQEVRLLDGLRETAERLLTQEAQPVLAHLVALARDLMNAGAGAVWVFEQGQPVLLAASDGYPAGAASLPDQELAQRALATGTALVYDRRAGTAVAPPAAWSHTLVMPVFSAGDRRPMGALVVHQANEAEAAGAPPASPARGEGGPSEWDKKVLGILAHYAALAIANAVRRDALAQAQDARAVAETFAALGDVAANLLHHLNNKVGTIPVRIEGIQDKCGPALAANPYLAANLAEIERAALDALATVRERLSLLRPIETGPVAVADALADALGRARLPDGVRVTAEALQDLPPVLAGRESLALVIANLLENAAAALNGHGRVDIRGRALADRVEVIVRDDGPGIAPELHGRIFDFSFSGERGERPLARNKLGFGLWWVKTVMARLGGAITVESDGRSGATFVLHLPLAAVSHA